MSDELLSANEAARRLGMSVTALYDWLGQSDWRILVIRGERVTINYLQGGPKGQGRIKLEASEIERLKDLMRVRPRNLSPRRSPVRMNSLPGIHVQLGRPNQHHR